MGETFTAFNCNRIDSKLSRVVTESTCLNGRYQLRKLFPPFSLSTCNGKVLLLSVSLLSIFSRFLRILLVFFCIFMIFTRFFLYFLTLPQPILCFSPFLRFFLYFFCRFSSDFFLYFVLFHKFSTFSCSFLTFSIHSTLFRAFFPISLIFREKRGSFRLWPFFQTFSSRSYLYRLSFG